MRIKRWLVLGLMGCCGVASGLPPEPLSDDAVQGLAQTDGAWDDALLGEAAQNMPFDEAVFTDLSPILPTPEAVKLPADQQLDD